MSNCTPPRSSVCMAALSLGHISSGIGVSFEKLCPKS
jgi:hypothetical protein